MTKVRVPEEITGTVFPCYAIDGSQERRRHTDTERLLWLLRWLRLRDFPLAHHLGGDEREMIEGIDFNLDKEAA